MTTIQMDFATTLERFKNSPLWGYYLPVTDEVVELFVEGNNRRVICRINNETEIRAAIMFSKSRPFIMLNKALVDKLGLMEGEAVSIHLEKDTSEYGMEMPEELGELLMQDEDGSKYFHALTPGKQRSLIYIVSKVKNTNSRLNKALAIVQHLKDMKGNIDYKGLNETIKYYNNL